MSSSDREQDPRQRAGANRRTFIGGGLLSVVAAGAGAAAATSLERDKVEPTSPEEAMVLPGEVVHTFHGARQAGIAEPPQAASTLIAFDLDEGGDRERVRRLMRIWTDDIERLMSGRGTLTDQEPELAQRSAGLTVTVGWGPRLFVLAELEAVRPTWAQDLPAFSHDQLDPAYSGGDLVLQISAHSPITVAHAQRQLTTSSAGLASTRWVQPGFREPMEYHGWSMRNLFGQVDGTVQPRFEGPDADLVWIGPDGPTGWQHGSSMVVRRIAMKLDAWDRVGRTGRENAIGRHLDDGSPITGGPVDAPVDLSATLDNGLPVVDGAAHVRLAAATTRQEQFLRRPYTYQDMDGGEVRTGLVFVTYQADPVRQFVPVQQRLADGDLMNLWTTPVGSALFAVLPGCSPGRYLGQDLLT
ncbi:MAG: Dyp-type peroxidase [Ornithinimicrobium sp.]